MISKYVVVALVSVMMASLSQVLLKRSALINYSSAWREYINPYVICGYGILMFSMLLTVYVYSGLPYKNVPLIESLGNVFVLIMSYFAFGERISTKKIVGIGFIILGIVIFNI